MRKIVRGVLITLLIVVTLVALFLFRWFYRENRAVKMAKEYLKEKYSQPMIYEGVRYPVVDPAVYHVYFSPSDNREIIFEVLVQADLSIATTSRENHKIVPQSADNYYPQFFGYALMKYLSPDVRKVFGENADINVVTSSGTYGHYVPEGLNDKLSLDEMENIYDKYRIYILIDEIYPDEEALRKLSEETWEFICMLKEKDYIPVEFGVQYLDESGNMKHIRFGDISTINSEEQVEKVLLSE